MDCVHPPRLEYHYFMAQGGPPIANFLIQVLTATADVLDGISVFAAMKSLNIYDVSKNEQKMRVLTASAGKVESEVFKQIVQRKLDQIGSEEN